MARARSSPPDGARQTRVPSTAPGTPPTDRPRQGLAIGELAACTGVTAETIRYYEREGVIPAAARRGAGRYRRYEARDAERLRFVRRARDLGFSLDEVRELLALAARDSGDQCENVGSIARAHLAQVNEKIAHLLALQAELTHVVGACRGGAGQPGCGILGALSGA
jgi:DNA-binding transcriptional MerR regulator